MRINSLFEHDASMKRQAEESSNNMPGTVFDSTGPEVQEIPPPKGGKNEKGEKGRHRASIACASCRDRRIRVSGILLLGLGWI